MIYGCESRTLNCGLRAAVLGCLAFALAGTPSVAEEGSAEQTANLRDLYFGPPVIPPQQILRAEEPAPAPRAAPRLARPMVAKKATPTTVAKRASQSTYARQESRKKIVVAPAPRARATRPVLALYKEAVPNPAHAFSGEQSVRWRQCLPGVHMPLVCYLPADDRLRIIVNPEN